MTRALLTIGFAGALALACAEPPLELIPEEVDPCIPGLVERTCDPDGAHAMACDGDEPVRGTLCDSGMCVDGLGCVECRPGEPACHGQMRAVCAEDGSGFVDDVECPATAGLTCDPVLRDCAEFCRPETEASYVGCEYWPTTTSNTLLAQEFVFAVAVANTSGEPTAVVITEGDRVVAERIVEGDSVETIELPWIQEVKGPIFSDGNEHSSIVPNGAYRLRSTSPVTVYQFNPLDYRIDQDCGAGDQSIDGECLSYTNDASLLLPGHVLTQDYVVISRPHWWVQRPSFDTQSPSFFTVTAVEEGTTTVRLTLSAHVRSSIDGELVRGYAPGEVAELSLEQGDVLQIVTDHAPECPAGSPEHGGQTYCDLGPTYDLTGTQITADRRIAVIAGHNCTNVPSDRIACDHLEESMFPLDTWGDEVVVSITEPIEDEPNVVRVVSGAAGNQLTFDPPVHDPVTLDLGEYIELETDLDFVVRGSGALAVAQFMVGQGRGEADVGDPAMSLGVPSEQFRAEYVFLTPDTYIESRVNVTALAGQAVVIDGVPVDGWRAVGDSGFVTARVQVEPGIHHIDSPEPFGIVVYGLGRYTSYMYPGGLDLEPINPLI